MLPEKPLSSYYQKYYRENIDFYIEKYGPEKGPIMLEKDIEHLQSRRENMYKEDEDLGEALNLMQRRQRGRVMKRFKAKIARARIRNAKRIATTDKLMSRARKAAKALIRKRFAGKMGENYANLSPSQKETIDKRLESKKALVGKIAKRIFPKIKAKEMMRFRNRNKKKMSEEAIVSEAKVNAMTVVFDKLDKRSIDSFKKMLEKEKIKILKSAGKMVVVDIKDDDEKDYLVTAADELGVGIDIKMGARI